MASPHVLRRGPSTQSPSANPCKTRQSSFASLRAFKFHLPESTCARPRSRNHTLCGLLPTPDSVSTACRVAPSTVSQGPELDLSLSNTDPKRVNQSSDCVAACSAGVVRLLGLLGHLIACVSALHTTLPQTLLPQLVLRAPRALAWLLAPPLSARSRSLVC